VLAGVCPTPDPADCVLPDGEELPDTDGDGLFDGYEDAYGLDRNDPSDAAADGDGDGLSNLEEARAGTDPANPDTDGDRIFDGEEVERGTDPLSAPEPVLDDRCTASALNQTVRVNPDGTFTIPNLPGAGQTFSVRVLCTDGEGLVTGGISESLVALGGESIPIGPLEVGDLPPTARSLEVSVEPTTLTQAGATAQIRVNATFSDESVRDVTLQSEGTSYVSSNGAIAGVDPDGLVTAGSRAGVALLSVRFDGVFAATRVSVVLGDDSDGDGIPDDLELANGLDPDDPSDGAADFDGDGLTNKQELVDFGTELNDPDSDGDGIEDGEEVTPGVDGFVTDPRLVDTDGDGVSDPLEIASGSDPTDPASVNLAGVVTALEIDPFVFTLSVNTVLGEASLPFSVTGQLIDGSSLDLTARATGTTYESSDELVCQFGLEDGLVFAGNDGACTVTVENSGFSAELALTVETFSPQPVSFVAIPGFANNVEVAGDYAFVAAGASGLVVVDVATKNAAVVVATVASRSNANDVVVVGDLAYVADGIGLTLFDLSDPASPFLLSHLALSGVAWDVAVRGNLALVAAGGSGLKVVDVTNPGAPALLGSAGLSSTAKGVAFSSDGSHALVATTTGGVTVDLTDPAAPVPGEALAAGTDVRDIATEGDVALLADSADGLIVIDVSDPSSPGTIGSLPVETVGRLNDLALRGVVSAGADIVFVNSVPLVNVSNPALPFSPGQIDFSGFRDDNGAGIALDGTHLYLAADPSITENGTTGDSRLYIGQVMALIDNAGIPPSVSIVAIGGGADLVEGEAIPVEVEASDDVGVEQVELLVDGVPVGSDSSSPFQFKLLVPAGVASIDIGARAEDLGGNTGTAAQETRGVVPDPLTTVVGSVVASGAPAAGAAVQVAFEAIVETGSSSLQTGPLVVGPDMIGRANVTGTVSFDAGVRMLAGDEIDLAAAGAFTVTGTEEFDLSGAAFGQPIDGFIGLDLTAASGVSMRIDTEIVGLLPFPGTFPFESESVLTVLDDGGVPSVTPLVGSDVRTANRGTVTLVLSPIGAVLDVIVEFTLDVVARGGPSGVTDADGLFSIEGVQTIFGGLTVDASVGDSVGRSERTPVVRGGATDVGEIVVP
jgi:hypothetical protein